MNNKVNIVRITDGLGNQLFQYAFAYGLYRRTGREFIIDPMFSGKRRRYQLDLFQLDYDKRFVGERTDNILGLGDRNSAPLRLKYRECKAKMNRYETIKETMPMKHDESVYQREPSYYVGFWQSYCYFDEFYDDIRRQFRLKEKADAMRNTHYREMRTYIREGQSVSLHIRRTDYDRQRNNVCLAGLFYKQALESMVQEIGDFSLFVFTDDKDFVRKNFYFHNYVLVEGLSDLEEFCLLQECKHHIIANSTYSWWGAYLANDKGGIVYAPVSGIWTEDFYLPQWRKINTQIGQPLWKENSNRME